MDGDIDDELIPPEGLRRKITMLEPMEPIVVHKMYITKFMTFILMAIWMAGLGYWYGRPTPDRFKARMDQMQVIGKCAPEKETDPYSIKFRDLDTKEIIELSVDKKALYDYFQIDTTLALVRIISKNDNK